MDIMGDIKSMTLPELRAEAYRLAIMQCNAWAQGDNQQADQIGLAIVAVQHRIAYMVDVATGRTPTTEGEVIEVGFVAAEKVEGNEEIEEQQRPVWVDPGDRIEGYKARAQKEIDTIYEQVAKDIYRTTARDRYLGVPIDKIYRGDKARGYAGAGMVMSAICTAYGCQWDRVVEAICAQNAIVGKKIKAGRYSSYRAFRGDLILYLCNRGAQMLVNHKRIYREMVPAEETKKSGDEDSEDRIDRDSYSAWADEEYNDSDPDALDGIIAQAVGACRTDHQATCMQQVLGAIVADRELTAEEKKMRRFLIDRGFMSQAQENVLKIPDIAGRLERMRRLDATAKADEERKKEEKRNKKKETKRKKE